MERLHTWKEDDPIQMKGGAPQYENEQMAEIKASDMVKKGEKNYRGLRD